MINEESPPEREALAEDRTPSNGDSANPASGTDSTTESDHASATPPDESSPIAGLFDRVTREIAKIYVGQEDFVRGTLVALFAGGHVLIESVPGLGKTLLVRVLGRVLGCQFNRIQFTPDLMPTDVTGAPIYDMHEQQFRFRPGPVFTQLLLADEINRAPAKTHSALLEIMQERHVTIDGTRYPIEAPFLVLATQNPIESEGTYNLPEAQLDRFMFKVVVDYPSDVEESDILRLHCRPVSVEQGIEQIETVTGPEEIQEAQWHCNSVSVDDKVIDYISAIVRRTREWPQLYLGASPRAGISLLAGARVLATFRGRDFVVPDDVVDLALAALRHRVILSPEAEVEGRRTDDVIMEIVRSIEVPRL
ncbi:ATPase family associated with various cellular activities (AAA) [Planctomycetes bacterium Pan216]|uniref:ATPase family associated with various cellular activities (AAA) n=1 Tax=Kolteria novifilia TaxID=2527975 RepID=A0A518B5L1_9BACT|nr:ATPase family associated with various cellular activities (AAA) [Planctomycetes bacterium Pan216]